MLQRLMIPGARSSITGLVSAVVGKIKASCSSFHRYLRAWLYLPACLAVVIVALALSSPLPSRGHLIITRIYMICPF